MTTESVFIDTLRADPANARIHSRRNLEAIKSSLQRFGQQKPIVVDARGIVRAGNGTLAAAIALGWKQIQIVRSDLAASEATAYAIADNRTSDLSDWDQKALGQQLQSLRDEGLDLNELGFNDRDMKKMLDQTDETAGQMPDEEKWLVVVTCRDEADQTAFLEQMEKEGRSCKALLA